MNLKQIQEGRNELPAKWIQKDSSDKSCLNMYAAAKLLGERKINQNLNRPREDRAQQDQSEWSASLKRF